MARDWKTVEEEEEKVLVVNRRLCLFLSERNQHRGSNDKVGRGGQNNFTEQL